MGATEPAAVGHVNPAGIIRTLGIIIFALTTGVLTFLAVAIGLVTTNGPAVDDATFAGVMVPLALLVTAVTQVARVFVLKSVDAKARHQAARGLAGRPDAAVDSGVFLPAFLTRTIITAALSEGPAILFVIVYFLTGAPIALVMAVLLLAQIMLLFPTAGRVEAYLAGQAERLAEARATGTL